MSFTPPSFVDACAYMVRRLVRTAYGMGANSVRPAKQEYPTGKEAEEFATVGIIKGPSGDFGSSSIVNTDDPTTGSTKVLESIEVGYRFTASIQFFRHASPTVDSAGQAPFGMGAVDKAARLDAILASSAMLALMEAMGLGLEGSGDPVDVGALVDDSRWEDRGSVTFDFVVINREQFLIESYASAGVEVRIAEPGQTTPTVQTFEVTQ